MVDHVLRKTNVQRLVCASRLEGSSAKGTTCIRKGRQLEQENGLTHYVTLIHTRKLQHMQHIITLRVAQGWREANDLVIFQAPVFWTTPSNVANYYLLLFTTSW